ncbi:hypothetical protein MNBD_GAMMA07-696 [hydrothermal vent metagenome]|uniref:Uncharacterized protein n=1 Tax=hydrothermal vent metagenome TaxID=652676 RepID=A0A3B0XMJ5_9ZZZZ
MKIIFTLLVLILLSSTTLNARESWNDSLGMESISIVGSSESPKTLYISPWKTTRLHAKFIKSENALINEILAPVERGAFRHHMKYFVRK